MDTTEITTRPAWATTEFWLTVIPVILLLAKGLLGDDTTSSIDVNAVATGAAALLGAGYAISRAITKRGVALAQADVATTKAGIAYDREVKSSRPLGLVSDGRVENLMIQIEELQSKVGLLEAAQKPARAARKL